MIDAKGSRTPALASGSLLQEHPISRASISRASPPQILARYIRRASPPVFTSIPGITNSRDSQQLCIDAFTQNTSWSLTRTFASDHSRLDFPNSIMGSRIWSATILCEDHFDTDGGYRTQSQSLCIFRSF